MAAAQKLLILICSITYFQVAFGVNHKLVPNHLLDLRLMSLFMFKHFVITFYPNGPKRNASKEVPIFDHFAILFGIFFPKQCLLPIEVVNSNPAKFMHSECGPSPCPHGLIAIQNICLTDSFVLGMQKNTLLRD